LLLVFESRKEREREREKEKVLLITGDEGGREEGRSQGSYVLVVIVVAASSLIVATFKCNPRELGEVK
jgi:hypothetical protein